MAAVLELDAAVQDLRVRASLDSPGLAGRSREEARFELRCSSCGYGVVVRIAPESCPMCQGSVWEYLPAMPWDAHL
jgi:rubrerythrin